MDDLKKENDGIIRDYIKKGGKKVKLRRESLFTHINKIQQQKDKIVIKIREEQNLMRRSTKSHRKYLDFVIKQARDLELVQQFADIKERLQFIYSTAVSSFSWRKHEINIEYKLARNFFTVADVRFEIKKKNSERKILQRQETNQILSKVHLLDAGIISGMVVMDQTLFMVHYNDSNLYIYSLTQPECHQEILVENLSGPYNMVRFPPQNHQLVIHDVKSKQLL